MAGGMATVCPIIPGLVIDYHKPLSNSLTLVAMLLVAAALGKAVRHFTGTGARIAVVSSIVLGWYVVLSHSLRF